MSLQQLLRNYQAKKKQRDSATKNVKGQIERRIEDQTIATLKLQNHKVNQIHKNQQAIQGKLKKQQDLLLELRKNEQIWIGLYQQLNRSLMQAGDLTHYAGYVQAEISELIGEGSVAKFLQDAERQQEKNYSTKININQLEIERQKEQHGLLKPSQLEDRMYEEIVENDEKFDSII